MFIKLIEIGYWFSRAVLEKLGYLSALTVLLSVLSPLPAMNFRKFDRLFANASPLAPSCLPTFETDGCNFD